MITRREFNRRMNAMNARLLMMENAVDDLLDALAQVDVNRNRLDVLTQEFGKSSVQTEANFANLWYKVNTYQGDFRLLCDYLGVEILDTAAKREVVKRGKK